MGQTPAIYPGDLDSMFNGLADRWPQYNVTVHSRSPWIVTLDNFIEDELVEGLLDTVRDQFRRSTDQGAVDERGVMEQVVSSKRTSENAWCTGVCEKSAASLEINRRISEVVNVPVDNFETLQILKYEKNQFYEQHNDMSDSDNLGPSGPRIYTFFLYLSDVQEGGETGFPFAGVKVRPKKGSAVLWPSVLSDNPTQQEARAGHQAHQVIDGVKFAANAWVHLYNFQEPNLWGCTGAMEGVL